MQSIKFILSVFSLSILAACGGSSGSEEQTPAGSQIPADQQTPGDQQTPDEQPTPLPIEFDITQHSSTQLDSDRDTQGVLKATLIKNGEFAATYKWQQIEGPEVVIENPDQADTHFPIPAVAIASDLVFQSTITDTAGTDYQQEITVKVSKPTQSYIDDIYDRNGSDTLESAPLLALNTEMERNFYSDTADFVAADLEAGIHYEFALYRHSIWGRHVHVKLFDDSLSEVSSDLLEDVKVNTYTTSLRFTPNTSGRYTLKMTGNQAAHYSVHYHEFVDADGDNSSSFFDCNDNNAEEYPRPYRLYVNSAGRQVVMDPSKDGIDQDCDGSDTLDPLTPDATEPANDEFATATPLPKIMGRFEEASLRTELQFNTLHTLGDVDYHKVDIPAKAAVILGTKSYEVPTYRKVYFDMFILNEQGEPRYIDFDTPPIVQGMKSLQYKNISDSSATLYLLRQGEENVFSGGISYLAWYQDLGFDRDGDGEYSLDDDCDDNDATRYWGATEIPDDGIDQDCDGQDQITP